MDLLVGLGNPGPKHQRERHNVGFMAVEAIARAHAFSRPRRRFQGEVLQGELAGRAVLALLPHTFMNRSGESVGAACRYHGIPASGVTVLHDEVDLAPGKVRVKRGGGNAGHQGLADIDRHLGRDYRRVRIGIGRPPGPRAAERYVLRNFSRAERTWLDPLLEVIAGAAPLLAEDRDDRFMSEVARLAPPPGADGDG